MASTTHRQPRNVVALGFGFGIGILWLLMAGVSFLSALRGYGNQRYDWALMWGVVGFLMLVAGLAAMVGTWWHQTRIHDDY